MTYYLELFLTFDDLLQAQVMMIMMKMMMTWLMTWCISSNTLFLLHQAAVDPANQLIKLAAGREGSAWPISGH